jgi:alkanesulfonate monooxygenase SsuD/methylene tetrahydromethanopterin reductase-like flavin-dependent oxidoreductase (luciferase family)
LRDAVEVTRLMWSGERSVRYDGDFYGLHGLHPGPQPAHDMQIWLGVGGPKLLRYLGGHADGWLPSNTYFPPQALPGMSEQIDRGAVDSDRDLASIIRAYNVFGEIGHSRARTVSWVGAAVDRNPDLARRRDRHGHVHLRRA